MGKQASILIAAAAIVISLVLLVRPSPTPTANAALAGTAGIAINHALAAVLLCFGVILAVHAMRHKHPGDDPSDNAKSPEQPDGVKPGE